jgi:dTDP-4-dehydrorhamnose 3,5-epimerase
MEKSPKLIHGDISIDDRGELTYCNEFKFDTIKRFYTVKNHKQNFIRAWHGHKNEGKYCMPIEGIWLIGAVQIDNWDNPSKDLNVTKYILSASRPEILYIPPGYANGLMNLTSNAKIIFYSTSTIEEAKNDDFRFSYNQWNIWQENYR